MHPHDEVTPPGPAAEFGAGTDQASALLQERGRRGITGNPRHSRVVATSRGGPDRGLTGGHRHPGKPGAQSLQSLGHGRQVNEASRDPANAGGHGPFRAEHGTSAAQATMPVGCQRRRRRRSMPLWPARHRASSTGELPNVQGTSVCLPELF